MPNAKRRIPELDIARAVAVLAIIVYHTGMLFGSAAYPGTGMPARLVSFLDTFHLYTLFIVSGYLTSFDKPLDGRLLSKAARTTLLPYAVACLFIISGSAAWAIAQGTIVDALAQMQRWAAASLWGAGAAHPHALVQVERIGGIWFLPALFWAKLFIGAIARLPRAARPVAVVAAFAFAYFSAPVVWLPLSLQSGLCAVAFMYVGWLLRQHAERLRGLAVRIPLTIVCALAWAAAIRWGGNSSIAMATFPAGPVDILGGVGATWCILQLSSLVVFLLPPVAHLLELVGRNTLPLFALHIVEDNTVPWGTLIQALLGTFGAYPWTWIVLVCCRLAIEAVLIVLVYLVPFLRRVFFPHVRTTLREQLGRIWGALGATSRIGDEPQLP